MTVQEVIEKIKNEKQQQVPARFHCRAIMVRDVQQYKELLAKLKSLPDTKVVPIDILFSGADVLPNYETLVNRDYQDEWLILPGVSEYLRLFHASEENNQRFGSLWHHQFDSLSKGRIIIPLWGCKTLWFDNALHLNDDMRQADDFFDCSDGAETAQKMKIQVFSDVFQQYADQFIPRRKSVFRGIREWYRAWYNPPADIEEQILLTRRYASVKATEGDICIHVIPDILSFVQDKFYTDAQLTHDNCPTDAQKYLFKEALKDITLDKAILNALNVLEIKPIDVMSKWTSLSVGQKQIVFLWYRQHSDDTYLSHCVALSKTIEDLPNRLLMAIFQVHNRKPNWVAESQALVDAIPLQRTDEYYQALEEIPSYEERLNYLSGKDSKERIYILHLVGLWLREEPDAVRQCERLHDIYPSLLAYLKNDYPDEALNAYFSKYRLYKLSNTLPVDLELYFNDFDVEEYKYRYPVIAEMANDQTYVVWVDALGAEWVPLLKWALTKCCDGDIIGTEIVQAQLPSETCFNEQWKQMNLPYVKYDRLDKLAHKGVIDNKDYYACIEEQLRFVFTIAEKVNSLLKEYPRVIVAGDHGTSRLAARFFHKNEGLDVPKQATVGSHGRYCKVSKDCNYVLSTQKALKENDETYVVFENYDHYKQPGFAAGADDDVPTYGEIHGGASPEETLIPVITINSRHEIPLTGKWDMANNTTKITNRRVKCKIQFSKPVTSVQAKIESYIADCDADVKPSKNWILVFSGIRLEKSKTFDVTVIAEGRLINMDRITIIPALGGCDPF